jgi:hypothetical protein
MAATEAWKKLRDLSRADLLREMEAHCLLECVDNPEELTKAELLSELESQIQWIDRHLEEMAFAHNTQRRSDDISAYLGINKTAPA